MRPAPYIFETADGKKFTIDCLSLGQIRQLEEFFKDTDRRAKMGGIEHGMKVLEIIFSDSPEPVDVSKLKILGGAEELTKITQAIMAHGGMAIVSEGEAQPAKK